MPDMAPNGVISRAALGEQDVNMRIPFQVASEGVEDANETGSEVFRHVHLKKHT